MYDESDEVCVIKREIKSFTQKSKILHLLQNVMSNASTQLLEVTVK